MTIPIRPAALHNTLTPASAAVLHVAFGDHTLRARSGQTPTFSRAATASIVDSLGTSLTLGHHLPAYEPRDWLRTGARTHAGLLLGTSDRLSYPAQFRPAVCGFRLAFMMTGAMPADGIALWSITNDAVSGARLVLDSSGTYWRLSHHNGSASITATLAVAPVSGDSVELIGQLYGDGSVQLWQAINFAAMTATARTVAPASGTLGSTWGGGTARVRFGASGTGNYGSYWAQEFCQLLGIPTVRQLQRAA